MKETLIELDRDQMIRIEGGVWLYIAAAMSIWACANSIAYAVGYAVGSIEKAIDANS